MSEKAYIEDEAPSLIDDAMREPEAVDTLRPLPRISIQAFCASEELMTVLRRSAEDRRMARVHMRVVSGDIATATETFAASPTPNLVLIETRVSQDRLMAQLAELAEVCDPSTKVVLIGHNNDVRLYRELVRRGISEYLIAPVTLSDVMTCLSSIFVDPDAEPLGRSIAFVGAKGGVGSSTIAHNCAWTISELFETETILADMDLAFGTANIDFDQDPPQGIAEAVYSPERLDDVFLDRLLSKCASHLSMLAAPSMLDRTYDFNSSTFEQLMDVMQRSAPLIVLDVPHVWTDWSRKVLSEADDIVVVAAPDLTNLRNTKNLVDTLIKLRPNDHAPRLILNQVGMPKRPEIDTADFCEPLETEPVAIIPFDAQLFGNALNSGRMISETDPKAPVSEIISQLAHVLTGRVEMRKSRKSGLSLRGLLGRRAGRD
ncbi:MAG: components of type IV pilus [Rhizobiaceae bacterium MnEN-MB40S]|nr:MAG: components of type IV pilus [Rhizobiaceae bacterium MnEN-MB40S]